MSVEALRLVRGFENLTAPELSALLKLPEKDLLDLTDPTLSSERQLQIIRGYREAEADPDASSWTIFLKVVSAAGAIAGVVIPIASAVMGILGVVNAAKAAAS